MAQQNAKLQVNQEPRRGSPPRGKVVPFPANGHKLNFQVFSFRIYRIDKYFPFLNKWDPIHQWVFALFNATVVIIGLMIGWGQLNIAIKAYEREAKPPPPESSATPKKPQHKHHKAALHASYYIKLGLKHERAGGAHNYDLALRDYQNAARGGATIAPALIGRIYEEGRGRARNISLAIHWYKVGAAEGNRDAQVYLGFIYKLGDGVPSNKENACYYFGRAAAQNSPRALSQVTDYCSIHGGPDVVVADTGGVVNHSSDQEARANRIGSDLKGLY